MRIPRFWFPLLAVALAVCTHANAQNWDDAEFQTHAVGQNVYVLDSGMGGNIGVSAGPDGVFLIDDQFSELSAKLRAAISEFSNEAVRFVLNTHYHRDHTGGNEPLARTGVTVIAHDNVRTRLEQEDWLQKLDDPKFTLPVVTFNDSITFHFNGDEIHVFHVARAHTDGDSIVLFRGADVIHMGDVFFNGLYPFLDVDGGASIDGLIAAVERTMDLAGPETKIIPGHGPITDREGLTTYLLLLKDVRGKIGTMIREGKTLEEVQAASPSAAYDEIWGKAFIKPDRLAKTIYQSLTR